ncbi:MAG: hypothetical protein CMP47_07175 [Rickettsiales bacterium]|nr:hypothetical protein [Rickettsiales bacterium]
MASVREKLEAEWAYRLMSPIGVYPRSEIHADDISLVVTDSLVALASSGDGTNQELFYTAILTSSVAASEHLRLYPFPYQHQLLDSCSPQGLGKQLEFDVRQKLVAEFATEGETVPEFDWYENAKGASLPPILNGTGYHFADIEIDITCAQHIYQMLKSSACPKLAGASKALNQCNALSAHFQFREEASGLLFDCLRLMQEVDDFHAVSAQLSTVLTQLGDSAEDYLISRQQMSKNLSPIEFHRVFVQTCSQLRKHLLGL